MLSILVRSYREENGLTAKEFIEKLGVNITPSYLTAIETKNEIPSPLVLHEIASLLKIDFKMLFDWARQTKLVKYKEKLDRLYK